MRTKKLVSILVLVLILAFAYFSYTTALSNFTLSDKTNTYLGNITFHRAAAGLEEGFQIAQQENKPVMVYFWAIWCQYCAGFQIKTLGNPDVKKILEEDYVLVAMDLDIDREVAQEYGVSYPPYLVLISPKLFSWDEIPGNDSERLIDFLTQKFGVDWVKTAKIEKIDNDMTIKVYTEKNSLSLTLNDEKTRVNLKIDRVWTDELIAKPGNNTLNIFPLERIPGAVGPEYLLPIVTQVRDQVWS